MSLRCAGVALGIAAWIGSTPAAAQSISLSDVFRSALACQLVEPALADMPVAELFRRDRAVCVAGLPDAADTAWFADRECTLPVPVEPTSQARWCAALLDEGRLGEARGVGALPVWTRSPGSRLDLGARSLDGVLQPWLARETFRTIDTPRGRCSLEMRIYAPAPVVDGRAADNAPSAGASGRPLIAWHGGSWSNRGFGSFGLELTIPHFTARGFTVYMPFYRLLGDSDGSAACQQADFENDIVADAHAAVDWVRDNGSRYGTQGRPVLFGQSAGGQLAARIAVDRPDDIAGAVLFYAPSDFTDFALRAQSGAYADEQGLGILERVLNGPLDSADISTAPIAPNTLPLRILRDGIDAPPMFMLHGDADTLVEPRQSVRLCDALAGRQLPATDEPVAATRGLREVTSCGSDSTLHRVSQGQHALDVCLLAGPLPLDSCLSGSEGSRERVADAIGSAAVFAEAAAAAGNSAAPDPMLQVDDEPPAAGGSGGGGALGAWWWLVVLLARRAGRPACR